ncbi:hypothetical protein E2C01_071828 [Portunus trituberculatus]|uniref:Uncharacterized protein n=1 Tax=Portunus trituberculatus TaxID=210409 RepID=A0A5B7I637_PORTR|nr:hypothetical protein [Portunus trituberculatus]
MTPPNPNGSGWSSIMACPTPSMLTFLPRQRPTHSSWALLKGLCPAWSTSSAWATFKGPPCLLLPSTPKFLNPLLLVVILPPAAWRKYMLALESSSCVATVGATTTPLHAASLPGPDPSGSHRTPASQSAPPGWFSSLPHLRNTVPG